MDKAFMEVFLWTLLAFVLTWTTYHVTNRRKKATKLADVAVEEIRYGGPDVIIVGAGVGGSALAYALAKVHTMALTLDSFASEYSTNDRITTLCINRF